MAFHHYVERYPFLASDRCASLIHRAPVLSSLVARAAQNQNRTEIPKGFVRANCCNHTIFSIGWLLDLPCRSASLMRQRGLFLVAAHQPVTSEANNARQQHRTSQNKQEQIQHVSKRFFHAFPYLLARQFHQLWSLRSLPWCLPWPFSSLSLWDPLVPQRSKKMSSNCSQMQKLLWDDFVLKRCKRGGLLFGSWDYINEIKHEEQYLILSIYLISIWMIGISNKPIINIINLQNNQSTCLPAGVLVLVTQKGDNS